jgi:hypothetical protein
MTSKVSPELANKKISVRFSNLTFAEAIHKIFEGQPFDYVVVEGKSVIVMGTSQGSAAVNGPATASSSPSGEEYISGQNPPAVVQTPFGPILSSRENPPTPEGIGPTAAPRDPNSFNNTQPGLNGSTNTLSPNPVFNPQTNANSAPATLFPSLQPRPKP